MASYGAEFCELRVNEVSRESRDDMTDPDVVHLRGGLRWAAAVDSLRLNRERRLVSRTGIEPP
jgi:hypothetical protein